MIDLSTGELVFAPLVRLRAGDTLETVASLDLGEGSIVQDMGTEWAWLRVRNVRVGPEYAVMHFGFHAKGLRCVTLAVSLERFAPLASWAEWSEATERQLLAEYRRWIRHELGREGTFPWGTIVAEYDEKSAGSSILIRYQ